MRSQSKWSAAITIISISSMLVLFNNCSKNGFGEVAVDPSALEAHAAESDFAVIGPDGSIVNSKSNLDSNAIHSEKVYWNGNGNATTAPRWRNGVVNWYYNPAGQPSVFTTDQALAILQKSMATWQAVCGIKWVYQGTTARTTAQTSDQYVTIGWGSAHGYTGGYTTVMWDGNLYLIDSDAEFSSTGIRDATAFFGVANHELGHQLGLDHSDVVESIMYANPYHDVNYMATLRNDDVTGCVGLYGQSLVAPTPTPTPSATPVVTPTPKPTVTPTPTPVPTATPKPTVTPTPTPKPTATPKPTPRWRWR